jgi:hypothetical protein
VQCAQERSELRAELQGIDVRLRDFASGNELRAEERPGKLVGRACNVRRDRDRERQQRREQRQELNLALDQRRRDRAARKAERDLAVRDEDGVVPAFRERSSTSGNCEPISRRASSSSTRISASQARTGDP